MPNFFPNADFLKTDMNIPLNNGTIHEILSAQPFIPLPKAINIRDLGLLPHSPIPPSLIYRSGSLSSVTPPSLFNLNIKTILDLRSESEVQRHPNPVPSVWIPFTKAPSPIGMSKFVEEDGVKAYKEMYCEIAEICAPGFRRAFEWVRGWVVIDGGMVVHCTGKDRTGVLSALLLSLAGASRELIAYDYTLTRIGVEPRREVLLQMLKLWNKEWTNETPGIREFVQVKGEYILAFLDAVAERYGGVRGYVRDVLVFEEDEVVAMELVLRGESGAKDGQMTA
ncbi:hypothetical protein EK21DRAFT_84573 [Setomelanomma holmii]|uniref:Tyrosine specific protein phosphatases domain-containing protein n=1 Tax=Setomelanomma holmii TaxID=210430 RepID=A0A9P4LT84_9PLEO|nr:hypothetical protein EK21DRAFT_84573 [Setomelanomma holmii]